jgi:putative ABC transport system permease protein
MKLITLINKTIKYYWKQNLALLLGTIISTAVLTGALIIGDSVRSSLIHLVDLRLGKAEFALVTGDRFVRTQLATEISDKLKVESAPLLYTQGIAINTNNQTRINKTDIIGIDDRFWELSDKEVIELNDDEVIVNSNIAERLQLNIGDEILIRLEKPSIIPLNAPFVSEEDQTQSFRLIIKAIVDEDNLGRFSLKSNQAEPYNIFVSREFISQELDLEDLCNIILTSNIENKNLTQNELDNFLDRSWKLKDLSLQVREIEETNEIEIISDRIFIDEAISKEIEAIAFPQKKILSYLVNSIEANGNETPYSFASALNAENINNNETIINQWLADDLKVKIGDSISMKYYIVGPLRKLQEETSYFKISAIIPTESELSNKTLMPAFPGLADAGSCSDWETGVPIDLKKIRDKDEKYWDDFKGTPKAYISFEKGKEIWDNNFGTVTSIRFNKKDISIDELRNELHKKLNPKLAGLFFIPVKEKGIIAAKNMVDFGELFLSLSFFIIAAGLLLTFLIYSFNTQSRSKESGILAGLGLNKKLILKIRIWESFIVIIVGGCLGALVGILYNYGILAGINSIWEDVVRTNMIDVYIIPTTLITGVIIGALLSIITVFLVTRNSLKHSVSDLVKSYYTQNTLNIKFKNRVFFIISILAYSIVLLILIFSFVNSSNLNASLYLSAGGIFLTGCIFLINNFLAFDKSNSDKDLSVSTLAFKNAKRNKGRSLATIILLAIGTFSVIITGANRKSFYGTEENKNSGTGGFLYWIEMTVPILKDLNSDEGKEEYGLFGESVFDSTKFLQMHLFDGDDASCLNLNQVQNPKILGIDADLLQKREAFSFDKILNGLDTKKLWNELDKNYGENVIPAIADQTVIQWGLLKSVGDTLYYSNENGDELKLVLIAGLGASVFQGHILISEKHFIENFPSISGSQIMLVDDNNKNASSLSEELKFYFQDYGIEINETSDRLKEFYSVTNSYLSIFLALGALGVIIGTIGLGIVLLRNMMDRKSEIAILLATGFKRKQVFKIIFYENLMVLIIGMIIGILSALIGILPSIMSPSFVMPIGFISAVTLLIFVSGLIWIYFPAKIAMKENLVQTLREE